MRANGAVSSSSPSSPQLYGVNSSAVDVLMLRVDVGVPARAIIAGERARDGPRRVPAIDSLRADVDTDDVIGVHPRELVVLADGGVGHGRHEVLDGAVTEGVLQAVGLTKEDNFVAAAVG